MEADDILRVIAHADDFAIGIATYLEFHARTSALIELLFESPDPIVRSIVCAVLHGTKQRSAREALLAALFDPNEAVRSAAAHAYGAVGRKQDGAIVLAALRLETSDEVRYHLLGDIGSIQYQGAFPFLVELLRDRRWRLESIIALGQLKGPEVRAVLAQELAGEEDWRTSLWLRKMIELVDARAARDAWEAEHDEPMPRPLTAEEMERILIEDSPDILDCYQYFAIHATAEEVKRVLQRKRITDKTVRYLMKDNVLRSIKERDRRGY
jgi:HEAT repeat protein